MKNALKFSEDDLPFGEQQTNLDWIGRIRRAHCKGNRTKERKRKMKGTNIDTNKNRLIYGPQNSKMFLLKDRYYPAACTSDQPS